MRYSDEAVIVRNRGLGRALWRLVIGLIIITLVGQAIYNAADGHYASLIARVGAIYLLSFGLRS